MNASNLFDQFKNHKVRIGRVTKIAPEPTQPVDVYDGRIAFSQDKFRFLPFEIKNRISHYRSTERVVTGSEKMIVFHLESRRVTEILRLLDALYPVKQSRT